MNTNADYPHYNPNLDDVVFYLQDYPHYNPNLDDVVFYLQDYPH
jgi:energy-converting hydrogenase Eha subunit F